MSEEVNEEHAERVPVQPLLGFVLGVVSGVIYPGLFVLLMLTWIIPALIALVLRISPRTRALAVGFGAASVGWLVYYVALYVYLLVASALS